MFVCFVLDPNDSTSSSEFDYHTILPDSLANISNVFQTPWNGLNLLTDQPNLVLESKSQLIDRTDTEVANASEVIKPFITDAKEVASEIGSFLFFYLIWENAESVKYKADLFGNESGEVANEIGSLFYSFI